MSAPEATTGAGRGRREIDADASTPGSGPTPARTDAARRTGPSRADIPAVIAAAGLLTLAGGCASLGVGQGSGDGGGGEAAADTVARADTARDGGDDADAAADTVGGASLRDSVLAELKARQAADTAADGGDGPTGSDRERKVIAEEGPSGPVRTTDVDSLRALGPVYTPYDVPPLLRRKGLEDLLRATILPAIRRHGLEPDEWARFWVLVDEDGRVVDHRVHLGSGHTAFDEAAAAAARALRYRPAMRGDEPVPVWVLVRISLLMDTG